jgi:signal transduction histidine kinase
MRLARRPALLALLLIALLALSAMLAHEAWSSARNRRVLADQAMHEYASYAAAKYRDNVQSWLYTALDELFAVAWVRLDEDASISGAAALEQSARALQGCKCGPTIGALYFFDVSLDSLPRAGVPLIATRGEVTPDSAELSWVTDTLRAHAFARPNNLRIAKQLFGALAMGHQYATIYAKYGDRLTVLVYTLRHDAEGKPVAAYGMLTDAERFVAPFFEPLYRSRIVLPPVPGKWVPTDSAFSVAAVDSLGRVFFASPVQYGSPLFSEVNMDTPLGHLRIRFAVNPRAREAVLAGGIPRSRVPLLLGALAATAILIVLTLLQVRSEVEYARQRANFAASVSHELRTPLAQILLFAETVRLGRATSESRRMHAVDVIIREARRLMRLVDNVLHVSRFERTQASVSLEWIEARHVMDEITEEFAPLAAEGEATIELEPVDAAIVMNADPGAVRQMLLNVLDNAVKYGRHGQVIQVGVALAGTVVRIWVDDEGPGVQASDRGRIWRPFVRLAQVNQRGVAGAGIGLAVVHELVTALRGRAWVEQGSRGGARFVLELPGGVADDTGEHASSTGDDAGAPDALDAPRAPDAPRSPGATERTGA